MFRLAHISDLHLLSLRGASPLAFFNKRVTGGLNLLLGRAQSHRAEIVKLALHDLAGRDVDHLVVTGDLSNLSLNAEFALARELLEAFGDGRRVSVIPGNHDAYTFRSMREQAFEGAFAGFMQTDVPELVTDRCYPYVKLLDDVAVIGLSSAIATPPPLATGRVSAAQVRGLRAALEHDEVARRFKVVLVHHHFFNPAHKRLHRMRRLINRDAVLTALLEGGADLVLHGHNHRHAFTEVPRDDGDAVMHVSDVGSTSAAHPEDAERAAKFNIYEIEGGRLAALRAFSHGLDAHDGPSDRVGDAPDGAGRFRPWKTIEPSA